MNFTPLESTSKLDMIIMSAMLPGILICVVVAVLALLTAHILKKDSEELITPAFILGLIVAAIFVVVNVNVSIENNKNALEHNRKAGTENIMQKYDVKDVLWTSPQTKVAPNLKPDYENTKRELVVETNDEKKYIFLYSLNKETFEPTLEDMAIPSGGSEKESISAKSLLKK